MAPPPPGIGDEPSGWGWGEVAALCVRGDIPKICQKIPKISQKSARRGGSGTSRCPWILLEPHSPARCIGNGSCEGARCPHFSRIPVIFPFFCPKFSVIPKIFLFPCPNFPRIPRFLFPCPHFSRFPILFPFSALNFPEFL